MTPEMFRKLAVLGLSHDQMAGVLEIFEEDAETRKSKARARVQKWREKAKDVTLQNVTERHVTLRNVTSRLTRVEDGSSISENKEIKEGKKEGRAPTAPRDELATVLDGDHVEAVIEHRKGFKGKFSTRAAHLLAIEFGKCHDPNAAVDEMIRRNWQGFKAEWMDNSRGPGPPRRNGNGIDPMMAEIKARYEADDDRQGEATSHSGTIRSLPPPGTRGH